MLLVAACPLMGDEVLLTNGTKLIGNVEELSKGLLTMETDFAGRLQINISKLVGITADRKLTVALKAGERATGTSVMAARVVDAIADNQLYILSEEGGAWRAACDARLDDLRLARNPTGPALTLGN